MPEPSEWPYEAVVYGNEVYGECLAVTGSGKPCTNSAYSDAALCGTHRDASDPDVLHSAHQWCRIRALHDAAWETVAVCVNCHAVWSGGPPALAVACPVCEATPGDRCFDPSSVANTAHLPHPARRERGFGAVDGYQPCPDNPFGASDRELGEQQVRLSEVDRAP